MLEKDTNLVIGKINSGKTKGVLFKEVERAIQNNENILIADNREEYYQTFSKTLKEKGYDVKVVNFNSPSKSNGYNPILLPYMLYKQSKKDECFDLLKKFCLELCKDESTTMDPFWTNTASDYLMSLILTLFKIAKENQINFGSIGTMMNQAQKKYNDTTLFRKYLDTIDVSENIYTLASSTEFAPPETKGSILSVLREKISSILMREELLNMLSSNEIDFMNLNDKTAIFLIGKSDLVNVFVDQLYYVIKENKTIFNIVIDNIYNYSPILELNEMVEEASYYHMKLNVSVRTKDELEQKYGKNLIEKFQNVIDINDKDLELIEVGSNEEYPILKDKNKNYFNLEEYIKENIK